jgi:DNA-binding NarL/FixJ family response regulator
VRVVIGEDDALYREGLARLLREGGFDVVAQASDADELLRRVAGHRPDVVVTDMRMPPDKTDDGLRAAVAIRARFPEIAVLVLSQYIAQRPALELIGDRAEGVGYLLKDRVADLDQFLDAVRRVAAGGSALDPQLITRLLNRGHATPLDDLTPREREVLGLMAEGQSNQGIADQLVVTEHTVTKHIGGILRKLDIPLAPDGHRRVLAVLAYLRAPENPSENPTF